MMIVVASSALAAFRQAGHNWKKMNERSENIDTNVLEATVSRFFSLALLALLLALLSLISFHKIA